MSIAPKVKAGRGPGGRKPTHGARAVVERQRDRLMDGRYLGAHMVSGTFVGFADDYGGLDSIGEGTKAVLESAAYQTLARDLWWTWAIKSHAATGEWPSPPKWLYTNDASLTRNLIAAAELEAQRRQHGSRSESLPEYLSRRAQAAEGDTPAASPNDLPQAAMDGGSPSNNGHAAEAAAEPARVDVHDVGQDNGHVDAIVAQAGPCAARTQEPPDA